MYWRLTRTRCLFFRAPRAPYYHLPAAFLPAFVFLYHLFPLIWIFGTDCPLDEKKRRHRHIAQHLIFIKLYLAPRHWISTDILVVVNFFAARWRRSLNRSIEINKNCIRWLDKFDYDLRRKSNSLLVVIINEIVLVSDYNSLRLVVYSTGWFRAIG